MKGGKLLAEGGYGCIYWPEINKKGEEIITEMNKYASKIQRKDESAKNEILIGNIVKEIDGFYNHFSPIISNKNINISGIESNILNKCSIIKKKKIKKFSLMKLIYIEGKSFNTWLINQKNNTLIFHQLIQSYIHLLKGLNILNENNIVHFDLKGNNILFNEKMNVPILIDFGLSLHMKDLNKSNKELKEMFFGYHPDYYIWPIEIHYLCFILHNERKPDKEEIKKMIEIYIGENRSLYKNFSPIFLKNYYKLCLNQIISYTKKTIRESIDMILKFNETWDNYALSLLYLKFIYYLNLDGYIENKFIIFFSKLLLKNINPDPLKRLSPMNTQKEFGGYLYKKEINNIMTFNEIKKLIVKNKKGMNEKLNNDKKYDKKVSNSKRKEK